MPEFFRVIKVASDKFTVDYFGAPLICSCRKKNKQNAVLAGDFVKVEDGVITEVASRRNRLIRPAIANVDRIIIVVSSVPAPDLLMLDKMLINCCAAGIDATVCLNKSDINSLDFCKEIKAQYSHYDTVVLDALHGKIEPLTHLLKGKLTCLAGQSAVGKSTIINALLGANRRETGEVSAINRGRNTTTDTELFSAYGGLIADTPGFSLLDVFDAKLSELDLFYPEFACLINECKYHRCTHTVEPDCAVKNAVAQGIINKERYKRYTQLFDELTEKKKNEYR